MGRDDLELYSKLTSEVGKKQVEIIGGDELKELTNLKVLHYSCLMFLNLIKT